MWLLFTLLATLLWGSAGVITKHIISKEMRDPLTIAFLSGASASVFFGILALVLGGSLAMPPAAVFGAFLSGVLIVAAGVTYLTALRREELSQAFAVIQLNPAFTLILASVFLSEAFVQAKYVGMLLMVIGAVGISTHFSVKGPLLTRAFWLTVLAALFISVRDVILKYTTGEAQLMSILLWMAVGSFAASAALFAVHHPHITAHFRKSAEHIVLAVFIDIVAFVLYFAALSLGPVSLVAATKSFEVLFVLAFALLLTKFHPSIVRENVNFTAMEKKILASVMIILGVFLVA